MWEELRLPGSVICKRSENKSVFNKDWEASFIFLLSQHILTAILLQLTKYNHPKNMQKREKWTHNAGLNETSAKAV